MRARPYTQVQNLAIRRWRREGKSWAMIEENYHRRFPDEKRSASNLKWHFYHALYRKRAGARRKKATTPSAPRAQGKGGQNKYQWLIEGTTNIVRRVALLQKENNRLRAANIDLRKGLRKARAEARAATTLTESEQRLLASRLDRVRKARKRASHAMVEHSKDYRRGPALQSYNPRFSNLAPRTPAAHARKSSGLFSFLEADSIINATIDISKKIPIIDLRIP